MNDELQKMLENNIKTQNEIKYKITEKKLMIFQILLGILCFITISGFLLVQGLLINLLWIYVACFFSVKLTKKIFGDLVNEVADDIKTMFSHNYKKELNALQIENSLISETIDKLEVLKLKYPIEELKKEEIKRLNLVNSLIFDYAKKGMKLVRKNVSNYTTEEFEVLEQINYEEQKIKKRGRLR